MLLIVCELLFLFILSVIYKHIYVLLRVIVYVVLVDPNVIFILAILRLQR